MMEMHWNFQCSSLHPYFLHMLTTGCCFIPVHAYGQAVVFVLQFKIHMRPICAYGVVILSLTAQRIPFESHSPLLIILEVIVLLLIEFSRISTKALVCEHHEAIGVCRCFGLCSEELRLNEDTLFPFIV